MITRIFEIYFVVLAIATVGRLLGVSRRNNL